MTPAIREAMILASSDDATCRVAGVPLLVRTLIVLQRAGVKRCTVVGSVAAPTDTRIRCAVTTAPRLTPAVDDALRLVVGQGAIVDEGLVRDLQRRARPGLAVTLEADGACIRVVPGTRLLEDTGAGGRPEVGTLASTATPPGRVEHALLRGLENPRDGYLDRLLHRPLSRLLTRVLLHTPLAPNAITMIGVVVGVAGGLALGARSEGGVLGGVLALVLSGVLDCCDGEVARIQFTESGIGRMLDVAGDTLVHVALLAGIAMQLAHTGAWPGAGTLALLAAGVVGAFGAITWSERTDARRHRVVAWENRVLDGALSPLTTRDWYVFPVAFALAGRLDVLVPAAAWGAQVFWIVVLVLVWRVLGMAPVASAQRLVLKLGEEDPMLTVRGVYEVAIRVRDLRKAEAFYRTVLGFEVGRRDEKRNWVFLRAGRDGMIVLQEDSSAWPLQHFAFTVAESEIEPAAAALRAEGISVVGPVVHEWIPAKSLYFSDPDGHDLELCAPLEPGASR